MIIEDCREEQLTPFGVGCFILAHKPGGRLSKFLIVSLPEIVIGAPEHNEFGALFLDTMGIVFRSLSVSGLKQQMMDHMTIDEIIPQEQLKLQILNPKENT